MICDPPIHFIEYWYMTSSLIYQIIVNLSGPFGVKLSNGTDQVLGVLWVSVGDFVSLLPNFLVEL